MARDTGPIPTENQFPCRTLVACLTLNCRWVTISAARAPLAESPTPVQRAQTTPLAEHQQALFPCISKFVEGPGCCVVKFAANLNREISHTKLTAPEGSRGLATGPVPVPLLWHGRWGSGSMSGRVQAPWGPQKVT